MHASCLLSFQMVMGCLLLILRVLLSMSGAVFAPSAWAIEGPPQLWPNPVPCENILVHDNHPIIQPSIAILDALLTKRTFRVVSQTSERSLLSWFGLDELTPNQIAGLEVTIENRGLHRGRNEFEIGFSLAGGAIRFSIPPISVWRNVPASIDDLDDFFNGSNLIKLGDTDLGFPFGEHYLKVRNAYPTGLEIESQITLADLRAKLGAEIIIEIGAVGGDCDSQTAKREKAIRVRRRTEWVCQWPVFVLAGRTK
jgi:hypothetical protein